MICHAANRFSNIYLKHGELLKQSYTLALTSCVLAEKIWPAINSAIPQTSLLLLRYTSLYFIGPQIQQLCKSGRDLYLASHYGDVTGIVLTAAKVTVKATNLFLTIAQFVMPVFNLLTMTRLATTLGEIIVPLSRGAWFIGCSNQISDYYLNKNLVSELESLVQNERQRITKVMNNFLELLKNPVSACPKAIDPLALRLIRQCEGSSLDLFQDSCTLNDDEAMRYLAIVRECIEQKGFYSEAGTALSALGYAAMHISKLYPDSVVEWSLRWSISFLYLLKIVHKKIFLQKQQSKIDGHDGTTTTP